MIRVNGKRIGLILLIVVLVGTLLGGGVYIYQNKTEDPSSNGNQNRSPNRDSTQPPNYEAAAFVRRVLDGDTIKVDIIEVSDPHQGVGLGNDTVRLAGIDTEEMGVHKAVSEHKDVKNMTQAEYEETVYYQHALAAKNLIESLASEETKIYLDIDDLAHGKGPYRGLYGRLIAVAYVKNEEKWINLNSEVLNQEYPTDYDQSYKLINSYNSEFNPYDWLSSNS